MDERVSEKTILIRDIINGNVGMEEVKQTIDNMEKKYGEKFFPTYKIEKKEKPWDVNYLKELELQSMSGASSKEFIIHLAEVSITVRRRFFIQRIAITICIIVIILIIIAFIIIIF